MAWIGQKLAKIREKDEWKLNLGYAECDICDKEFWLFFIVFNLLG